MRQEPMLLSLRSMSRSSIEGAHLALETFNGCEPWPCHRKTDSAGEQSTGVCQGRTFRSCLLLRGYASAAASIRWSRRAPTLHAHKRRKYLPSPPPTETSHRHTTTFALTRHNSAAKAS